MRNSNSHQETAATGAQRRCDLCDCDHVQLFRVRKSGQTAIATSIRHQAAGGETE